MTAYVINYNGTPATIINYDFLPVTFAIRLARVDVYSTAGLSVALETVSGASLSGGSAVTPIPLRGGAASPACTATVKVGATLTPTPNFATDMVGEINVGQNGIATAGTLTYTTYSPGSGSYTAGYDLIIPVGSAFRIAILGYSGGSSFAGATNMTAYFEEVRPFLSF